MMLRPIREVQALLNLIVRAMEMRVVYLQGGLALLGLVLKQANEQAGGNS